MAARTISKAELATEVGRLWSDVAIQAKRAIKPALEAQGVTMTQAIAMQTLLVAGGRETARDLGRDCHMLASTVTGVIDRLEGAGHVRRERDQRDRRVVWVTLTDEGRALADFAARVIALRHRHPVLRCASFLHGKDQPAPDVLDIAWFDEHGQGLSPEAWNNPKERTLVLRRAEPDLDGSVPILTCLFNPTAEDRTFKLPPPRLPTQLLLDSAAPAAAEHPLDGETVAVKARSVVLTRSVYRK